MPLGDEVLGMQPMASSGTKVRKQYVCKIIGIGTYDDPFRPAIADVKIPSTNANAFDYSATIPTDVSGIPIGSICSVVADGDENLVIANPDVVVLP